MAFSLVLSTAIVFLMVWYFLFACRPLRLVYYKSPLNELLVRCIPRLTARYWPPFWGFNTHIQNGLARLRKSPKIKYRREKIFFEDGGHVALDWDGEMSDKGGTPIVIILHGITGGSHENYVRALILKLRNCGFLCGVYNRRGMSDLDLTSPSIPAYGDTSDMKALMKHVIDNYPENKVFGVGFSAGANLMTKYLGEVGSNSPFTACFSICSLFDCAGASSKLSGRFFYDKFLAAEVRHEYYTRHKQVLGLPPDKEKQLFRASSLRTFDDLFMRQIHKYGSIDDFYSAQSSKNFVRNVRTPLIVLHAIDDLLSPSCLVPLKEINANPFILVALSSRGGHLGFCQGFIDPLGSSLADDLCEECFSFFVSKSRKTEIGKAVRECEKLAISELGESEWLTD